MINKTAVKNIGKAEISLQTFEEGDRVVVVNCTGGNGLTGTIRGISAQAAYVTVWIVESDKILENGYSCFSMPGQCLCKI